MESLVSNYSVDELKIDSLKTEYMKLYDDDLIDAYEALILDLYKKLELNNSEKITNYELFVENEALHKKENKVIELLEYACLNKKLFTHESLVKRVLEIYGRISCFDDEWNYFIQDAPKDGTPILASWGDVMDDLEIKWASDISHPAFSSFSLYEGWVDCELNYPIDEPFRWKEIL